MFFKIIKFSCLESWYSRYLWFFCQNHDIVLKTLPVSPWQHLSCDPHPLIGLIIYTTFNYAGNNISFLYKFSPKKVLGQLPFRCLYTKEALNYQTWNNILSLESSTLFLFVAWCSCQTPLHFCATTVSSHYSVIFSVFLLVFTPPLKEKSTSLCKNPNEMFLWQICVKCPKVKS